MNPCNCCGRCENKDVRPDTLCSIKVEFSSSNPENAIYRLLAIHGAGEFFRALSAVSMKLSQQTDSSRRDLQGAWLALSARASNMEQACTKAGMSSPFTVRK